MEFPGPFYILGSETVEDSGGLGALFAQCGWAKHFRPSAVPGVVRSMAPYGAPVTLNTFKKKKIMWTL